MRVYQNRQAEQQSALREWIFNYTPQKELDSDKLFTYSPTKPNGEPNEIGNAKVI